MTMNPRIPPTRVQATRKFFAPYQQVILVVIGIIIGFVLSRV